MYNLGSGHQLSENYSTYHWEAIVQVENCWTLFMVGLFVAINHENHRARGGAPQF
jgi:hypothetical protein